MKKKKTTIISLNCQKLTFNIAVTALQLQRFEKASTNSTNFSRMMNYFIKSFLLKIRFYQWLSGKFNHIFPSNMYNNRTLTL